MLHEGFAVGGDVVFGGFFAEFVGLGEYNAEWYSVFAQELHEFKVDFLRLVARVDQQEEVGHLAALEYVAFDDFLQTLAVCLAALGVSVAREVHDVPAVVDQEVVDQHGLAWCRGCHGKILAPCKHVDERGFTNVASSDEGIFMFHPFRTFIDIGIADFESCCVDYHIW